MLCYVRTTCTAFLFNQTALATTFQWGEVACLADAKVDIDVEPRCGVIEARQEVAVTFSITPHVVGPTDLMIPCCVQVNGVQFVEFC